MYEEILSTNQLSNVIENNTPYAIFIRGDRSIDLTSNSSTPTATTLSTTGNNTTFLTGGPISTTLSQTNDAFSLVANPYQATVNFDLATTTNLRADIIVYNPSVGTNGQFVTLTSNRFVEPGQSFWVQNDGDVTNPAGGASIAFEETHKATSGSSGVGVFSEYSSISLNLELYKDENHLMDVMQFRFQSGGNNGYDDNDTGKILGSSESLCSVNSNTLLSVERRDLPQESESIPLNVFSYQGTDYKFKVNLENWDPSVDILIVDHYLNTLSEINPDEGYPYTVDNNILASKAIDRFSLVFKTQSLSSDEFSTAQDIVIYPNPLSGKDYISLKIPYDMLGQHATLTVYDVNGKFLNQTEYQSLNYTERFDASSLLPGIYILKVQVNDSIQSFKLSKF